MNEIWKSIFGFEELYEVSNMGRIRVPPIRSKYFNQNDIKTILIKINNKEKLINIAKEFNVNRALISYIKNHNHQYRILKPYMSSKYLSIDLRKNNQRFAKRIHHLVLETFMRSRKGKEECNHLNGIKTDNRLENLEWVTHSENCKHKYRVLGYETLHGERNGNSRLTEKDVLEIRKLCKQGCSQRKIAKLFHVCKTTIQYINNRKLWKHI